MASKPELLHNQAADEIGQDFLLAYQRAVLLALQRQGFLNEMQCRNCVQKLEEQKRKQKQEKIDKVKKECEESINLYSSVYNIKSEVVKKIVSDYTNNFSNKDFINNKTINDGEKHDSFDYEIIMLVSHLNDYPEEFGYDYSSIRKEDINSNLYNFTLVTN